jgi:integrase
VRPWTYKGYEVHVRLHLKPALGRVPLERLTALQVQKLVNDKSQTGLKPKTVRYILGTLRGALNQAIRWQLVSRNVAALVDGPRVEQFEIQPLTPDEARRFLASIKGDRLEALYSVALTMGLRQGEALGLRWKDIDLEMGYLRVSKQLQRFNGKLQLVEPKTRRSRRSLAMPTTIAKGLSHHRSRQAEELRTAGSRWIDTGLVFTTPIGTGLEGTAITKDFHRKLAQAGLPQRRFHDLRHSCATLLLVQGVSPRVVMDEIDTVGTDRLRTIREPGQPRRPAEVAPTLAELKDRWRHIVHRLSPRPPLVFHQIAPGFGQRLLLISDCYSELSTSARVSASNSTSTTKPSPTRAAT